MRLRLGTRGSALAVAQSEQVADQLRALGHEVELVRVKTFGDVTQGSLARTGSLGVFAAELRTALLDGACDFAVHSLKDLPTEPVDGLSIAAVPVRADHRDALCARDGLTFAALPAGASVGTGSPRRVAQLRAQRPDLVYVDVRGNVGTRLARVTSGDLDAVVLAAAGLERLGFTSAATDLLDILPSPGQGALALECRGDNAEVIAALSALDDADTHAAVDAERRVLAALGGGCAAPIAALGSGSTLTAGVFALDGGRQLRTQTPLDAGAGERAAQALLADGAAGIVDLGASRPSRLAELHDDSSLWGGPAVLAGTRVLLAREDGPLAEGVRAAGAEVVACPVTRRVPLRPAGWPTSADWVALTSPATLEVLDELGLSLPTGARIAAVGEATARAARQRGVEVDLVAGPRSSAAALLQVWPEAVSTVLVPGSALASGELVDGLLARGNEVHRVDVYTVEALSSTPSEVAAEYRQGLFDAVVVTSGSIGAAVGELLGWHARVIAFGPPSAAALRALGVEPDAVAGTQDAAGLIAAIASLG